MKNLFYACCLHCALLPVYSYANNDNVSWHGYVSQGITQSVDSRFITDDNDITFDLTELGLNGRYQLSQNFAVAGQVVYLNGGNRFEEGERLDYLFLDLSLPELCGWEGNLHVGRYKNRHWLFTATRDVPHTRNTAVLPQSSYSDGFRDIALSSDGVNLGLRRYYSKSIWDVNWSYGHSHINAAQTRFLLGEDTRGRAKQDFVHQLSVFWQPTSMQWKVGMSLLDSDFTYKPAQNDVRFAGQVDFVRMMLSLQYFAERWEVSSEFTRDIEDAQGMFTPTFRRKRRTEGAYAQARYRFTPSTSVLLGFETYVYDVADRDGAELVISSGGLIPAYFSYMDTYTLGGRWDFAPNWRIQAEHHWVDGAGRAVSLLNRNIAQHTQKNWRMWSVQLMYWF